MSDNLVPLIVALVGATGLGGLIRETSMFINKYRSGISAKEQDRKRDLVSERDYEYDRAELEARNRRRLEEYAAKLRRILAEHTSNVTVPKWPDLEEVPERMTNQTPKDEPK